MRAAFGAMSIDLKDGWADTTHDVPGEDVPLTLAHQSEDACGSFQFSTALYKSGALPRATAAKLAEMLFEFAEEHDLGEPSDSVVEDALLALAAATFRRGGDVIRVWYVSDGASFAKVTYLSAAIHNYASELADCEQMVRTIAFIREDEAA